MSLEILIGFDGNGPASQEAVRKTSDHGFVLSFPCIREKKEDRRGARLETRIRNTGSTALQAEIVVDMPGRENHIQNFDAAFIKHEQDADWTMIPGSREQERRMAYIFEARPGVTELSHCPAYNYETCRDFVESLRDREGVAVTTAGKSGAGRDLWVVDVASTDPEAPAYFVQARDHAYETAGNYCVEGMAAFLLSGDPLCRYLRHKFRFAFMPMTNPDGVAGGFLSMPSEHGTNVARAYPDSPGTEHEALHGTLERLKPKVHINIHNYTARFADQIMGEQQAFLDRVLESLPADPVHHKRWRTSSLADFWERSRDVLNAKGYTDETCRPREFYGWTNVSREQYGASAVSFEIPWFARTGADMRMRGRDMLVAVGLAAIDVQDM